jgi:hypothetical protein
MRKGQAALEYLTTYGWGFIAILLILGVLAYFGILSPSKYLPARCDFGAQMQCADYQITSGNLKLQLRNGFGDNIIIDGVYLFSERNPSTVTPASTTITKGNLSTVLTIVPGSTAQFVRGDRISVPVIITFHRAIAGPPLYHNVTGEVFATVN